MSKWNENRRAIDAYLRSMFVEVSKEEGKMQILHDAKRTSCEFCSGVAHYNTPVHNEGLAWHNLCEICMSCHGEPEHAIRIVHIPSAEHYPNWCDYCVEYLKWEEKQSVLPF